MHVRIRLFAAFSLLLTQLLLLPQAQASGPITFNTFSQNSPGINFTGSDNSYLRVDSSTSFNLGTSDFTIDWWQQASRSQSIYPRLFQFGEGGANSDGFAVSEEGGGMYFWLDSRTSGTRGGARVSLNLPEAPQTWTHYAVVKEGLTITIYADGVSINSYVESPVDPNDPYAPQSSLAAPNNIGELDLLIGGSLDSNLGAFGGRLTGFEIFRGARWSSNFTPPTSYTNESCLATSGSTCTLERLLLIYPTSDFTQPGNQLVNLMDNKPIYVAPDVTYFDQQSGGSQNQNTDSSTVTLENTFNGQICGDDLNQNPICSETTTTNTTAFFVSSIDTFTLYIDPFMNFQTDSITITPINGESVTVNLDSSIFTVVDQHNQTHSLRIYNDGELRIPPGLGDFSIGALFSPEKIRVELIASPHGSICVNLGLGQSLCEDTSTATLRQLKFANFSFLVTPDPGYKVETITVIPASVSGVEVNSNTETFTVLSFNSQPFTFEWNELTGEISVPSNFQNFAVSVDFLPISNGSSSSGIANPSQTVFDPVWFDDNLIITSSDENSDNDYTPVQSIILEIEYETNNPFVRPYTPESRTCRVYLNYEMLQLHTAMYVETPQIEEISYLCSGYHQITETTVAKIYLMSVPNPEINADPVIDPANILQEVDFNLYSPPGANRIFDSDQAHFGGELLADVSNINSLATIGLSIYSNDYFTNGECYVENQVRNQNGILPEFLNDSGYLIIPIPAVSEFNQLCGYAFKNGVNSINESGIYLSLWLSDQNYEGELIEYFWISPSNSNTNADTAPPAPAPQNRVETHSQTTETKELEEKVIEKPNSGITEDKTEHESIESIDNTWCTKKGIWIFTVTGKLRMCDPTKKVALEIKACAGRAETPTYPWIFRAQRFYSGEIPTKSGVKLYNAVFFFKGLAISGSNNVSDNPCSAGSVFIPMQYSKTILEFARREKPLIWVKAS